MRLPVAVTIQSRDGLVARDAKVVNAILERDGEELVARKRPGAYPVVLGKVGVAQAIMSWNGLFTVQDDYLNKGTLASVGTGANLSPTLADLPFSWNSTASGAATPRMMIKNRTQAWSVSRAGAASPITYGSSMGSYTYAVVSITRASTVATVTTNEDTGLAIGESVTIAGADQADYNGAQTVTGVTLGSYVPAEQIPVTLTRSGTTVTATTTPGYSGFYGNDHGLTSGASYTLASVTGNTESYYLGSFSITTSGGNTFTYTCTTTSPSAITGTLNPSDKAATVTLSGGNLTASFTAAGGTIASVRGTVSKASGVWAMEFTIGTMATNQMSFGMATSSQSLTTDPRLSANAWIYSWVASTGSGLIETSGVQKYCAAFVAGDKIGVVFDGDANTVSFYKNGEFMGVLTGVSGTVYPFVSSDGVYTTTPSVTANFAGSFTYSYTQPATPATGIITVTRPAATTLPTFTYTVGGSPATPATGTITAAVTGGTVPGIAYIDGYFCVMDVNGKIWNSASDDPTTWGALDFVIAQNEPGRAKALGKSQNYLVAFKEWSTEFFYNASLQSGSPFAPVVNGFTQVGTASGDSVASSDDLILWISQSRQAGRSVHMMSGIEQTKVSTPDVDRILNRDDLETVHSYCIRLDGHPLYVLTLVTSNITLVYDIDAKAWMQWSSLTQLATTDVTSITLSSDGRTATVVTDTAHGLADGEVVAIANADQSAYNTFFNITYVSSDTFTIEVDGTPASPATGTIICAGFDESYFKFTKHVNHNGLDLLLHESDGYIYDIRPTWFLDSIYPINFSARTARIDGGTLDRKKLAALRVVGDVDRGLYIPSSGRVLVRWSDDDCSTYSTFRGADLDEDDAQIRRCGAFKRRTFEIINSENVGMRIKALELQIGA